MTLLLCESLLLLLLLLSVSVDLTVMVEDDDDDEIDDDDGGGIVVGNESASVRVSMDRLLSLSLSNIGLFKCVSEFVM